MASKNHQFLFFILLPSCILSLTSSQSFRCGNGITLGYPFWTRNNVSNDALYHGYPGFNISCQGDNPYLIVSNQLYTVKTFNESEKTLTVTYTFDEEENDPTCPVVRHDVILNVSSLNFTKDDAMLHFFYNCTLYPPSLPSIKCLQFGAKHSYVFMNGSIPEFDWKHYCESVRISPVIRWMDIENGYVDLVNGSAKALMHGFKLTWKAESGCEICEATGGFCGHRTNGIGHNFPCLCSDGTQHPSICHDTGPIGLLASQSNFTVNGGLIVGGMISITSVVMYTVWKRKLSMYKHGFNQIPSKQWVMARFLPLD